MKEKNAPYGEIRAKSNLRNLNEEMYAEYDENTACFRITDGSVFGARVYLTVEMVHNLSRFVRDIEDDAI